MVYFLLLLVAVVFAVMSLIIDIIIKKGRLRRKKRRLTATFKGIWISLVTSAFTLVMVAFWLWFKQVVKNQQNSNFIVKKIEVWENELYFERIDPASFIDPIKIIITPTEKPREESVDSDETPRTKTSLPTEIPKRYDYSHLMIFGKHLFGEYITPSDLENMKSRYNDYWRSQEYWDMLEIPSDGIVNIVELDSRIGVFDEEVSSGVSKTAEEHFRNAEDRLYRYSIKNEDVSFLEQSAISCENAVECKNPTNLDEYNSLFTYIRAAVIRFSCVLDKGCEPYDSGKDNDIKYRMGKVLYKPVAVNLGLTRSERYYSLCSAYVVLKDAFDYSSLDSKFAVEVAYYYLLVCNDIVHAMEPDQSEEMKNRIKLAYYQFRERMNEKQGSFTYYNSYLYEAEKVMENLDR